jgi:hypothetical protein
MSHAIGSVGGVPDLPLRTRWRSWQMVGGAIQPDRFDLDPRLHSSVEYPKTLGPVNDAGHLRSAVVSSRLIGRA